MVVVATAIVGMVVIVAVVVAMATATGLATRTRTELFTLSTVSTCMAGRTSREESTLSAGDRFSRLVAGPFGTLVLPAIVLQSVVIGGGYATGREVVAYGAKYGALGALAVAVIFVGFTLTSILVFEFARVCDAYDYKRFVRALVGPAWPLFDLLYLAMGTIVIAVMIAAAGRVAQRTLAIPAPVTTVAVVVFVTALAARGAGLVERFATLGTLVLYGGYSIFGLLVLSAVWPDVLTVFATGTTAYVPRASVTAVAVDGVVYVGYNLAVYPAVLFTLARQETSRETIQSGVLAGVVMTLPFALTYLCLVGFYPTERVLSAPVPWLSMLDTVAGPGILALFGVVVGWTLIETSVGAIHALVDRIEGDVARTDSGRFADQSGLSGTQRAVLAGCVLTVAALGSRLGIVTLVAQGYAIMAYAFVALFAIPLCTVGVARIVRHHRAHEPRPEP
jgi:uncharacterized membrane protein YkvI